MDHEVVLCDLDGVVVDDVAAETMAFAGTATRVGLGDLGTVQPLYAAIDAACWRAHERGELSAEDVRVQRWARLFEATGVSADPRRVAADHRARLARAGPVLPGSVRALRRLAAVVPVVAVANGFTDVVTGRLAASGSRDLFRGVVVADQVAAPKPAAAMFHAALDMVGATPASAVMVGDDHHADIEGADAVSIDSVWIAPAGTARSPVATWQAVSLAAAADLLLGPAGGADEGGARSAEGSRRGRP